MDVFMTVVGIWVVTVAVTVSAEGVACDPQAIVPKLSSTIDVMSR